MLKAEYLSLAEVESFARWFESKLEAPRNAKSVGALHQWVSLSKRSGFEPGTTASSACVADAFDHYHWPTKDPSQGKKLTSFVENRECLKDLADKLESAIERSDGCACRQICNDVLAWGGVARRRHKKGSDAKGTLARVIGEMDDALLPAYLREVRRYLGTNDSDELSFTFSSRGTDYPLDVDSGTTKIYSLLAPGWIIYDGRVGSALAMLVGKWLGDRDSCDLGEPLRFAHAHERHRNPNPAGGPRIFPEMKNDASRFTHNVRASWIVQEVVRRDGRSSFARLEEADRCRALEAALFVLGYQIRSEV